MVNWKKVMLGAPAGGGGYWIGEFDGNGTEVDGASGGPFKMSFFSDNKTAVVAANSIQFDYSDGKVGLFSLNSDGTIGNIDKQIHFGYWGTEANPPYVYTDSSDNVYLQGPSGSTGVALIKLNSSGTIQGTRKYSASYIDHDYGGMVMDDGGLGTWFSAEYGAFPVLFGADTTTATFGLDWQNRNWAQTNQIWGYCGRKGSTWIAHGMLGPSGGSGTTTRFWAGTFGSVYSTAKTLSMGSYDTETTTPHVTSIATDGTNIFFNGMVKESSKWKPYIQKLNGSYAHQWTRVFSKSGVSGNSALYPNAGIAADSSGNSYVFQGDTDLGTPAGFRMFTLNSSGTLQSEYTFTRDNSNYFCRPVDMHFDGNDDLWICVHFYGTTGEFSSRTGSRYAILKIPADPSGIVGSYDMGAGGDWNISSTSLFSTASTTTSVGNFSLSLDNPSVSDSAYTDYTEPSTQISFTKVDI